MLKSFPPIIDEQTEILILGSFPSVKSLEENQYYGHKQNQFWKILGEIINIDLYNLPYDERIPIIKKHKIGIWDVYKNCTREGSLDSNIRNAVLNDFNLISKTCPNLKKILFNGTTAGKHRDKVPLQIEKHIVPSTSPANTKKFTEKLDAWKSFL